MRGLVLLRHRYNTLASRAGRQRRPQGECRTLHPDGAAAADTPGIYRDYGDQP